MRFVFLSMFLYRLVCADGTYNSFINQIGYCKMQSFETTSRSTSDSVPMFMDGRVKFGVGLSNENLERHEELLCGACIHVSNISRFYQWNEELTEWRYIDDHQGFLAMVFDRCPDPICGLDFLDFDIYNPKQPVAHGNPRDIVWNFVPCPVKQEERIEYLICTSITCNQNDAKNQSLVQVLSHEHYFFSITIRNTRIPIRGVFVYYQEMYHQLKKENSWVWDFSLYDLHRGIDITFIDVENKEFHDHLNVSRGVMKPNYNGAIYLVSNLQN